MTAPPALRLLRTRLGLSQRELAERLEESVDSIRVWDSGRRPAPAGVLKRAEALLADPNEQLLPLCVLGEQFDVHVRTLRAAARDGRLQATFSNHAFFGRAVALASPIAVAAFLNGSFGRRATQVQAARALVRVPADCGARIIGIRTRLGLSQSDLARRVGAANKAVVYQWETGKRRPSPVFWTRLVRLRKRRHVDMSLEQQRGFR